MLHFGREHHRGQLFAKAPGNKSRDAKMANKEAVFDFSSSIVVNSTHTLLQANQ